MTIKTAKKFMKMSALLGCVALGSLSLNAAAAVITFGTGTAGFGGDISFSDSPSGSVLEGDNINIGALTIAGSTSDGAYEVTNGVLSFSTVTGSLNIQGSVAGLGISSQTLLTGTMDEFFEGLTLIQTGKMKKNMPIILYGSEFWDKVMNLEALVEFGTISRADLDLFQVVDNVDDAYKIITDGLEEFAVDNPGPLL